MILFLAGMLLGSTLGFTIAALMNVSSQEDDNDDMSDMQR